MSSVLSEIVRWSKSLKYWEQAILDKILAGESFTEDAYTEIYGYFLEDNLLKEKESAERPSASFHR